MRGAHAVHDVGQVKHEYVPTCDADVDHSASISSSPQHETGFDDKQPHFVTETALVPVKTPPLDSGDEMEIANNLCELDQVLATSRLGRDFF